ATHTCQAADEETPMITHVWIDEGCIGCGACPTTAPLVFALDDQTDAVVLSDARQDGMTGPNRVERSPLRPALAAAEEAAIREAAEGCPVEVIRCREDD